MKLEGKVAIVTGGARDLGRAISVKLAAEGAKVCLNYFDNEADAQETLALIKNVGGEASCCGEESFCRVQQSFW